MKIALGLVTGIVLLAGQNTGTPSSHGEDILSWVQWPAPMACPPQQQHAGASRWFAPTIMRHCGAGGIGSPGGRTAAPVRSAVKQPRRPTNCGGTDSPLVDELALCRRDCSPARGSPQPPQPTSAPRRRGCFSTVRTGAKRQPCCRCGADTVGAGNSGREGRASHLRDTCR